MYTVRNENLGTSSELERTTGALSIWATCAASDPPGDTSLSGGTRPGAAVTKQQAGSEGGRHNIPATGMNTRKCSSESIGEKTTTSASRGADMEMARGLVACSGVSWTWSHSIRPLTPQPGPSVHLRFTRSKRPGGRRTCLSDCRV